jgi:hypothetical protein
MVAAHKARRYPQDAPVVDVCCGIGGDLRAIATRGPTKGVDRDEQIALVAEANCPGVTVQVADAAETDVEAFAAWHIDPDRRPHGRRTTRTALHDPPDSVLQDLLRRNPNAAVKLAPAADVTNPWLAGAALEWISRDAQCRQLVAWFGMFATTEDQRSATILRSGTSEAFTFEGRADVRPAVATQVGRYVFEPDPAIIAARLTGALAEHLDLRAIEEGIAYLTSDHHVTNLALVAFEIVDVMPFDLKRVKAWLRERGVGRLEVKKRGVELEPEDVRRRLRVDGDNAMTLIVAPVNARVTAILARREPSREGPAI